MIVDKPNQLPYGGMHQGREVFGQSILGAMLGDASLAVTDAEVLEGQPGVIGTLTSHTTGEEFPLTMVEIHQVEDGMVRKVGHRPSHA
ncbi:hypothetical protein ACFVZC_36055 [Streptomyces marokkonensis]|uniref:Uncharacterized protein n=1 Tax=Streptomyces marokkonensis TaxID=324855 RepID=A0ABW6QHP3_9ACTN